MNTDSTVHAYTDGACSGNPGPGGWAAILKSGGRVRTLAGAETRTTNNRMEMTAAIRALRTLSRPCRVTLVTDSEYLKNGITSWIANWKRNGWRTAAKKPVKNQDLWQELDELCATHDVRWQWVRGHAGHPENEACDKLATSLAERVLAGEPADSLTVDKRE